MATGDAPKLAEKKLTPAQEFERSGGLKGRKEGPQRRYSPAECKGVA